MKYLQEVSYHEEEVDKHLLVKLCRFGSYLIVFLEEDFAIEPDRHVLIGLFQNRSRKYQPKPFYLCTFFFSSS